VNTQAWQAAEVATLDREADMPIEELLAMYKAMAAGRGGGSDDDSDDAMHIESPHADGAPPPTLSLKLSIFHMPCVTLGKSACPMLTPFWC